MDASGTQHCAEMAPAKPWASRGTWHSLDSIWTWVYTADSDREQGRSALPTTAACCSNGYPLLSTGKKMAAYWLLPSTPRKAWEGRQCEDPEASQQGQLPPCSRAGLTPSPKAALAPGGRVATWPLWGQSVWLSAHASPGGYTDPGEDFTSLTRSSFTCEPGISVPTSSTHGSFDVTRPV